MKKHILFLLFLFAANVSLTGCEELFGSSGNQQNGCPDVLCGFDDPPGWVPPEDR